MHHKMLYGYGIRPCGMWLYNLCEYGIMKFMHDMGTYWQLQLVAEQS